ncbi:glycosyltransferase family 2 protein [Virgibacillus sp. DJP39]|uniref:glycosyltransferase family 2 protein n=1 Tax=Virgibacillus sp. DJP39 TaxID=3409790 RepID=UPI003BB4F0DD
MIPKISVIVPVYKAESYIQKCIDSILNQTYRDFELILIDDGSPDKSGEICDEYFLKDDRVIVKHKLNGGVSSARNAGIDLANGEFIMFVDSDDWLEYNALNTLNYNIIEDNSETYVFSLIKDLFSGNELIKSEFNGFYKKHEINVADLSKNFIYYLNSVGMQPSWMYLFKRSIIVNQKLYFNENLVLYEDFDFNLRYLRYSNKITLLPNALYHYNISISTNQLAKRNKVNIVPDINTVCKSLFDFLNYTGAKEGVIKHTYSYIFPMYILCLRNIIIHRKDTKLRGKFEVLKQLRSDLIYKQTIAEYGISLKFYRVFSLLINKQQYLLAYFLLLYKFSK